MRDTTRLVKRITALGSAAVLAVGLLSAAVGGAAAAGAMDCPGMQVTLSSAASISYGFGVDDDVTITVAGFPIIDDHTGLAELNAPITFPVHTGDQIHVVATNVVPYGGVNNAFVESLALWCTSNSNKQILEPVGFAPGDLGPGVFFDRYYTVLLQEPLFSFTGFSQPVDNLPTVNQMKAGAAVPVKFSLNGDQGLEIFADGYPKSQWITCTSTDALDGIEETTSAGSSSLTYDPVSDTYTYVWKTDKSWKGTCRQLVLKLTDGTYHRANFQFK